MDELSPDEAIKELRALLKRGGQLKIITATLREPGASPSPDPADYVQHEVVAIHEADDGLVIATSAEGDATVGGPVALLRRLRKWDPLGVEGIHRRARDDVRREREARDR